MMALAVLCVSRPLRVFHRLLPKGLACLALMFGLFANQAMAEQKSVSVTVTNLERSETPSIAGVEWVLFEILGEWFVADDPPTLTLQEDGSFSFYAGCNRFFGKATINGNRIAFPDAIAGTRRACHALVAQLERDVLDALTTSDQFERNANRLFLMREDGRVGLGFRAKS